HGGHHNQEDKLLGFKLNKDNGVGSQQREENLQNGGEHAGDGGVEHVVQQRLGAESVDVVGQIQGVGKVIAPQNVRKVRKAQTEGEQHGETHDHGRHSENGVGDD